MKHFPSCEVLFVIILLKIIGANFTESLTKTTKYTPAKPLIVGGQVAEPHEAPFLVSLHMHSKGHYCAGAIVNAKWILTAATCLNGIKAEHVNVLAGKYSIVAFDQSKQIRTGKRIIFHPQYKPPLINFDVALLEVFSPFNLKVREVKAAPLASEDFVPDFEKEVEIFGWGAVSEDGEKSDVVRKAVVPLVREEDCRKQYFPIQPISQDMLCAGGNGRDTCWGDVGTPLVCKNSGKDQRNRKIVCAVASKKFGCGREERPGIYKKVSSIASWITKTTVWKYIEKNMEWKNQTSSKIIRNNKYKF